MILMCEIYEERHEGEIKMKSISDLTGRMYENDDVVFFRNHVQAAYYHSWGCELVDLFVDNNMKWVFVFWKADHIKHRDRWGAKSKGEKDE